MAEVSYVGLVDALEDILKADSRLRDVTITQEPTMPFDFPWIRLDIRRANRRVVNIVGMIAAGQPDEVRVEIDIVVWAVSAQGGADASMQRDTLIATLVDVLRTPTGYTLGGRCAWLQVGDIAFASGIRENDQSNDNAGIYANATLRCEALCLT